MRRDLAPGLDALRAGRSIGEAAALVGVSRETFSRRLAELGIDARIARSAGRLESAGLTLEGALERLQGDEREVFRLLYSPPPFSLREAAAALGCSHTWAQRLVRQAWGRLERRGAPRPSPQKLPSGWIVVSCQCTARGLWPASERDLECGRCGEQVRPL